MSEFENEYKAAAEKATKYEQMERAGWAVPGKRTRDNHTIQIPRAEAVATARDLKRVIYAKELYLHWALNLKSCMMQLARGEHDEKMCQTCGGIFRAGWMDGKCPYCEAKQGADGYVMEHAIKVMEENTDELL